MAARACAACCPTREESDIARFWPGGGSNWNQTTRELVSSRSFDRWEHARLFALLNVGQADAFIANQMWKWTYTFWRPVTAIRWPDDGNPDTASDPIWRPFLVTPPYPDYPCALPTSAGAAAESLRQFFGTDDVPFTRTFNAPAVPLPDGMPSAAPQGDHAQLRDAVRLDRRGAECPRLCRLHFREGCQAGANQGIQVARFVAKHSLRPAKGKPAKDK